MAADQTTPRSFEARLLAVGQAVQDELSALLGEASLPGEIARAPRLLAAMRHGSLNGGKRLRPFLTVEAARLCGYEGAGALRAGCAVELIHCYSLVHEDLPARDDDDLVFPRPIHQDHRRARRQSGVGYGQGINAFRSP